MASEESLSPNSEPRISIGWSSPPSQLHFLLLQPQGPTELISLFLRHTLNHPTWCVFTHVPSPSGLPFFPSHPFVIKSSPRPLVKISRSPHDTRFPSYILFALRTPSICAMFSQFFFHMFPMKASQQYSKVGIVSIYTLQIRRKVFRDVNWFTQACTVSMWQKLSLNPGLLILC